MSYKNNNRVTEASKSQSTSIGATKSDQPDHSPHASGREKLHKETPKTFKEALAPSHDRSMPTPEETLEAYRRLGLLLRELYPVVKSKGYAIIDGKLTKVPVDSANTEKNGMMSPIEHRKKQKYERKTCK